jgi:hypothetical protein
VRGRHKEDRSLAWLFDFVAERCANPLYEYWLPGWTAYGEREPFRNSIVSEDKRDRVSVASAAVAGISKEGVLKEEEKWRRARARKKRAKKTSNFSVS